MPKPVALTRHAETVMRECDIKLEWVTLAATAPE